MGYRWRRPANSPAAHQLVDDALGMMMASVLEVAPQSYSCDSGNWRCAQRRDMLRKSAQQIKTARGHSRTANRIAGFESCAVGHAPGGHRSRAARCTFRRCSRAPPAPHATTAARRPRPSSLCSGDDLAFFHFVFCRAFRGDFLSRSFYNVAAGLSSHTIPLRNRRDFEPAVVSLKPDFQILGPLSRPDARVCH